MVIPSDRPVIISERYYRVVTVGLVCLLSSDCAAEASSDNFRTFRLSNFVAHGSQFVHLVVAAGSGKG